jgi:hypothetical protein
VTNSSIPTCTGEQVNNTGYFALLKVNDSQCVGDYVVASWKPPNSAPAFYANLSYKMRIAIFGNAIQCTYDYNRDGILDYSDPILQYIDPSPLPVTNRFEFVSIYI